MKSIDIMMFRFRFFGQLIMLFVVLFFAGIKQVEAQSVKAALDSSKILIGSQTKLTLEATIQKGTKISFPVVGDSLMKNVEVVAKTKVDTTVLPDKRLKLTQEYMVTSFDSGCYRIPAFKFMVNNDSLLTAPLSLMVNTIAVDTTKDFYDVKEPVNVPWSFREIMPYILGIIILAIIAILVIAIIRKIRKKEPLLMIRKPEEPPYLTAVKDLERLRNQKLWQQGKFKQYHTIITEIIRIYVNRMFHVKTLEQTSEEILQSLKNSGFDDEVSFNLLKQIFTLADLVKFAKENPLPEENELSLSNALLFVKNTQPFTDEQDKSRKAETSPDIKDLKN
ncbi:MAG: hypothetical protein Q8907_16260 [Bacteroidota bacterium]|nr:hypothetical protein [Bacteroidota bacterium]